MPIFFVVIDKVVVAVVVKLMRFVARQLHNLVPIFERHVANWTFGPSTRHANLEHYRLSETISEALYTWSVHFVVHIGFAPDSQSLLSNEFEIAIEGNLLHSNGMILEVVQLAQLKLNEVKRENLVLQLVIFVYNVAVGTAAAKDRKHNEEDWARNQEDKRM